MQNGHQYGLPTHLESLIDMNINFKTHFPWSGPDGKPEPTFFKEKIIASILDVDSIIVPGKKHHTIRRVPASGRPRYQEGMKLRMCTGSRYRPTLFADAVCTGTQAVELRLDRLAKLDYTLQVSVRIGGKGLPYGDADLFAANDGLSEQNFTKWFMLDVITNGPGSYHLVHWTGLRY